AGLAVLACLSAPFGISLGGSAQAILDVYSKVLVFAVLVMAAIRSARELWFFVLAYLIRTGAVVWMALFASHVTLEAGQRAPRIRRSDRRALDSGRAGRILGAHQHDHAPYARLQLGRNRRSQTALGAWDDVHARLPGVRHRHR